MNISWFYDLTGNSGFFLLNYFPSIYQSFNGSSEVLVTEKIIKAILLGFFPKVLKWVFTKSFSNRWASLLLQCRKLKYSKKNPSFIHLGKYDGQISLQLKIK